MARPKVPHCKECRYLKNLNDLWRWNKSINGNWKCTHPEKSTDKYGKQINGQEIRTSPLWCPYRYRKR